MMELDRHAFNYHRAIMSHGRLAPGGFEETQRKAQEGLKKIQENLKPWTRDTRTIEEKGKTWLKEWADAVGVDLSDPLWQEKREQQLEQRQKQHEQERQASKGVDETTIIRRQRERDEKTKAAMEAWRQRRPRRN